MTPAAAAQELLRRRAARATAVGFAEYVDVPGRPVTDDDEDCEAFLKVESKLAQHHKMILEEAERCFLADTGRLMIFMPPGAAKSTYASVVAPSYVMGKHPRTRCGLASYGGTLAKKMGRRTRSIINQRKYAQVFPNVALSKDSSAANEFTLTNGSEYMAIGILGAATGNRFNWLVIDDPIKGREDADSETIREKTWNAYEDDLKTRLVPGGSVMVIQCMTGDTQVLMADGSERNLRDVRPGDVIATYERGEITTSVVRNWANQGADSVFRIRMKSGTIVRANERHPFLVARNGGTEWVRLKNLTVGTEIVRATKNAGHGLAQCVQLTDAICPSGAKGIASLTTTKSDGRQATDRRRSTSNREQPRSSSIATESPSLITGACMKHSMDAALFVGNSQVQTFDPIGAANCALTTTMRREKCADYCATTATLLSDTEKPLKSSSVLLNTYSVTQDEIVSITPDGYEDVFDIQVDRTENFIANGLVSHNTRWHEDDLSGRILPSDWNGESGDIKCKDGNVWRVLCIQAECQTDSDPLGRQRGEMMWPEWFTEKHWAQFRGNARTWGSLCQQLPRPADGDLFKPDMIEVIDELPAGHITWVRGWDAAATEGGGDYTAGPKLGRTQDGRFIIADVVHGQWGPDRRDKIMSNTAKADGRNVFQDYPQDPGAAGKSQVVQWTKNVVGYPVVSSVESGDKVVRASPFAAQVNIGNVYMLRADWNRRFREELRAFPSGTFDDQVDGSSRAFNRLLEMAGRITVNKSLIDRIKR